MGGSQEKGAPDLAGGIQSRGLELGLGRLAFPKRKRIAGHCCTRGLGETGRTTVCGLGAMRNLVWPDSSSHLEPWVFTQH